MNNQNRELFIYCPKCGKVALNPSSPKFYMCDECDFIFYLNTAAAVAGIIVDENEKLLVAVRKSDPAKGTWDLPGGFVDYNESAEEAIKRELKEELNLDLSKISYFCSFPNTYYYKGITYETLDITFICDVASFENIAAADDVESYLFVPLQNIEVEKFGLQSMRRIVAEFIKYKMRDKNN